MSSQHKFMGFVDYGPTAFNDGDGVPYEPVVYEAKDGFTAVDPVTKKEGVVSFDPDKQRWILSINIEYDRIIADLENPGPFGPNNNPIKFNYEEVSEVAYKPSEVTILVHAVAAGEDTTLVADPTEIGTVDAPKVEGDVVSIVGTLTKTSDGTPIAGKTLHFLYPDGTPIGDADTDADGKATVDYTVRAQDDGAKLTVSYLGD